MDNSEFFNSPKWLASKYRSRISHLSTQLRSCGEEFIRIDKDIKSSIKSQEEWWENPEGNLLDNLPILIKNLEHISMLVANHMKYYNENDK